MQKYTYSLNNERLKRYIINNKNNEEDVINLYLWNIKLSKELYPMISLLEITLRNHINNSISQNISKQWLLDQDIARSILKDKELNTYFETYKKIKQVTEGKLIAELSLGLLLQQYIAFIRLAIS